LEVAPADVEPARLADSEMIEGADCGQVKRIFAKWTKSSAVGTLAGKARNAIIGADKTAEMARLAADKAKKGEDAAKAVGGASANGAAGDAADAAQKAEDAADDANDASTDLETKLDELKENAGNRAWETATGKMNAVKSETEKTMDATKKASKATQVALEMGKKATEVALSSADAAMEMVEKLAEKSEKALETAAETKQKAKFAVAETEKVLTNTDEIINDVNDKINSDEGDQKPVMEAYKDKLQKAYTSAEEAKDALKEKIASLTTTVDDVKTATEPVDDAKAEMAGGAGDPSGMGELADTMSELDTELRKLDDAEQLMSDQVDSLQKKKERLVKIGKEAKDLEGLRKKD
jgi:myosin heavy subunit